jgi:hypothetical protein
MGSLEFFTMALGSTQALTEMIKKDISWGKGGRYVGLTTLSPSLPIVKKFGEPQPPGTLRVCPGMYRDFFTLPIFLKRKFGIGHVYRQK